MTCVVFKAPGTFVAAVAVSAMIVWLALDWKYSARIDAQGARLPADPTQIALEVSPLFGYDLRTFSESWTRLPHPPAVVDGLYLS